MRTRNLVIIKLAAAVYWLFSANGTSAQSLSLEAHETGTGDGTYTRWYIDWDYYARDFTRQKRILITVHDFSRKVPAVTVQVYFIGHPMGRPEPLFVYGHASVPVELHGDLEVKGEINAPPLKGYVRQVGGIGHASGGDIDGWIVIGEYEGRTFQVRASRQRLLDLAERNRAALDDLAADYERHKPRK